MKHAAPLTPTEARVALWIAHGKSGGVIAAEMGISTNTLRVHMTHLRAKTNLPTLDPGKLKQYLHRAGHRETLPQEVTEAQAAVLGMLANGKSYDDITAALGINKGTAMNHASKGCKRLGITAQGKKRQEALRAALRPTAAPQDWRQDPMF